MYAKIANVPNAIADNPAARPSSPSVMFTALLVPTRMNVVNNTYKNLYSFFTRYDFRNGGLRGFSIGGGAARTGGNIFTSVGNYTAADGTRPASITLEAAWNASMFVGYKYNKNWDFRLNVINVTDKAFALGAQTPLFVDPSPPRTFQATATYKF